MRFMPFSCHGLVDKHLGCDRNSVCVWPGLARLQHESSKGGYLLGFEEGLWKTVIYADDLLPFDGEYFPQVGAYQLVLVGDKKFKLLGEHRFI